MEDLIKEVFVLSNYIKRALNELAKANNLTDAQSRFLFIIYNYENNGIKVTPKMIEKFFNNQKSGVCELLQTLESYNLISRIEDQTDSRKKYILLTNKGKECGKIALENHYKVLDKITKNFTKDELKIVNKMFTKMINNMEEY